MEYRFGRNTPKSKAPGIRRTLLMFLAFAYLFVGFAHSAVCFDEAFASTVSSESSVLPGDNSHDGNSRKSLVVGEHCHICAPVVMPALAPDASPSLRLIQIAFSTPNLLLEDHPRLDTPPPKQLT
ncbi:hypothetical protein [Bradyrhizobium sp.]|uniref:hypothetical protein n=1 Tax=Bradyrhizobium sp. TaxID=376 RepID=UPI0025B7D943|nr:hypothetical protein [Bradyrhizobium sp.]